MKKLNLLGKIRRDVVNVLKIHIFHCLVVEHCVWGKFFVIFGMDLWKV